MKSNNNKHITIICFQIHTCEYIHIITSTYRHIHMYVSMQFLHLRPFTRPLWTDAPNDESSKPRQLECWGTSRMELRLLNGGKNIYLHTYLLVCMYTYVYAYVLFFFFLLLCLLNSQMYLLLLLLLVAYQHRLKCCCHLSCHICSLPIWFCCWCLFLLR